MHDVLIAVGDTTFGKMLQPHVEQSHINLQFFECANKAIHFALENRPKMVLANYRLPDIDGISFLSRVRKISPDSFLVLYGSKELSQPVLQSAPHIYACLSNRSEMIMLINTIDRVPPCLQQQYAHDVLHTTDSSNVRAVLNDLSVSVTLPLN